MSDMNRRLQMVSAASRRSVAPASENSMYAMQRISALWHSSLSPYNDGFLKLDLFMRCEGRTRDRQAVPCTRIYMMKFLIELTRRERAIPMTRRRCAPSTIHLSSRDWSALPPRRVDTTYVHNDYLSSTYPNYYSPPQSRVRVHHAEGIRMLLNRLLSIFRTAVARRSKRPEKSEASTRIRRILCSSDPSSVDHWSIA